MPVSTAASRLRQMYSFSLLVKLKENFCYRCGEEIQSVEDFSLDHMVPWRNSTKDVFWDLGNIKPAHFTCNAGAHTGGTVFKVGHIPKNSRWTDAPDGTKWCCRCKMFVANTLFSKNRTTRDGLNSECRLCRRKFRSKGIYVTRDFTEGTANGEANRLESDGSERMTVQPSCPLPFCK